MVKWSERDHFTTQKKKKIHSKNNIYTNHDNFLSLTVNCIEILRVNLANSQNSRIFFEGVSLQLTQAPCYFILFFHFTIKLFCSHFLH